MKKISLISGTICLLLLLLLAFSALAASSKEKAPPPKTAQKPIRIKVAVPGYPPTLHSVIHWIAWDRGFFAEEGLDAQLLPIEADSTALKALVAGQVEAVDMNTGGLIVAMSQGANVQITGGVRTGMTWVILAGKNVKSLEDLKGKTIAISGIGSLSQMVVVAVLNKKGIKSEDVTWVPAGQSPARVQAIVAGKVDAAPVGMEQAITAMQISPGLQVVANIAKELPDYLYASQASGLETIRKRPEIVQKILYAHIKAARWIYSNKNTFLNAANFFMGYQDMNTLSKVYDMYVAGHAWDADGDGNSAALLAMQDYNIETKVQTAKVPTEKMLTRQFVDAYLAKYGRFRYP